MRILTCTPYHYYGDPNVIEPTALIFTQIPRQMGHHVCFFDFHEQAKMNKAGMNDMLLSAVKGGSFDLIFITLVGDEFYPETLDELKNYATTVAWNSDDDYRWKDYSAKWCSHFSYIVTTYRHIYEANKKAYPNLLLSQWGCPCFSEGISVGKDIDFSFVGLVYGSRIKDIRTLSKKTNLQYFGKNSELIRKRTIKTRIQLKIARLLGRSFIVPSVFPVDNIYDIWNRTKVSFTPLENSVGTGLQIKGRIFDMGMSGTVMLCNRYSVIDEFYDRDKEYVDFENLEECAEKAKYLLKNDEERQRIAKAYFDRTKSEHTWKRRFEKLFTEIGLSVYGESH